MASLLSARLTGTPFRSLSDGQARRVAVPCSRRRMPVARRAGPEGGEDMPDDMRDAMKADLQRFQQKEAAAQQPAARRLNVESRWGPQAPPKEQEKSMKDKVDEFLIADFFLVVAILVWLLAGVAQSSMTSGEQTLLLDMWYPLWPLVWQPALGVLMLGALVSGGLSWHDVIRSARQSIQPSTSYHQELSLHDLGIVSSSQSYVRQATSAGTQAQASTSSARSYVSGGTAAYELTARIKAATRPPQLLALVSQHAPALNVIHLTAAATSLARSCTAPLEDSLGGPQSEATQQLAGFLRLVQARCSALDARGCANVVWAVARLRTSAASSGSALAVELDATMASLLPAATLHAHEFSPQHVANVLWALAVTDVSAHTQPNGSNAGGGSSGGGAEAVSGAAPEVAGASRPSSGGAVPSSSSANGSREPYGVNGSSAPYAAIGNTVPRSANGSSTAGPCANGSARASLQGQLLESARPHLASFTPQGAANTLWAAATLRASPSDEWLFDFFGTTQPALPQWGCQAAANTLWAAATLHAAPPPAWCDALWSATRRRLGTEWDAQALSNTLWAAGSLRLDVPHHWLAAAATACQSRLDKFSDQQLASALWGLARLAAGGDATWAVRVLLPALDARVRSGRMSDAEVAMATWAKARMRLPALSHVQFHTAGGPGGGASAAAAAAAAAAGGSADRGGGAARRPPLLSPSQLGSRSLAAALHACALASRARLMSPPEQVAALGLLAQLPAAAAGRGGGGGMDGRTLASSLTAAARLRYRPSPEWADDAWSAFAVVSGSSSGGMQRQRSAGSGGGNGGMAPGEAALSLWALASMRARPVGAVASAALLSAAGCTQQAQVSPQHLPGHTSSSSSAEAASPSQLQMRSRSQPQASAPSLVDALRLLHAAAAWRLSPGPARQLWAALTRPSTGTGNSGPLSRPGLLPLRALCSAMLHAGRIGAQPSPEWLRAAADRVEALVPTAGPREVAALLEAAALLAANRQRAAAASGGERTTTASGAARSEGTDEQLAAASSSSRSTRSSNAPLRAVFDACMERVDSGGLWCSGISSSGGGAYGTSDDARLLRSLVAHRRLTRWLDARGADDALTAYVLVSSAAAAALVPAAVVVPVVVAVVMSARAAGTTAAGNSGIVAPAMAPAFVPPAALAPMPEPRAPPTRLASLSTSQLLHVLRWATALSPPPATLPPQWLAAAGDTLGSRLAAMPTNDAVRVLPALLRAGFIPSRTWLGDYMATVFQRANGLSPAHAAAVTGALAKLDARLHAMWLQQLSVTYGDGQ
ncbi:hypothetical protein FOA52_012127 [Chlamydomonas sp. UWO 241]|nr:hypothetical protein FOA52_012127 [Chlamydomonas sp. UWO 241]